MYVWRACFFRFTLPATFEFFSLDASCQRLRTHTGTYAHFDPSPLMDRRTHVLLIFLPIPGQQWHVGKSCAYEAKTISCQCCFIFGQKAKVGREFLWHGPHTHTCTYTRGYSGTRTWDKANKVIATKQCCQTAENMKLPAQHSLITVGCDRDRNIIFDILDIHMYACALCEVFPFLLAAFFTWRQNVNKNCRYRWHILQVLRPTNCSNINSLSIFCDISWKLLPVAILFVDSTNLV